MTTEQFSFRLAQSRNQILVLFLLLMVSLRLSSQNVGINNSDPQYSLDVEGTSYADTILVKQEENAIELAANDKTTRLRISTDFTQPGFQNAYLSFFENSNLYGSLYISETNGGKNVNLNSLGTLRLSGQSSGNQNGYVRIVLGSISSVGPDGIYVTRAPSTLGIPRGLFDIRGSLVSDSTETSLFKLNASGNIPSLPDIGSIYLDNGINTGGDIAPRWWDGGKWNTVNVISSIQDDDNDSKIKFIEGAQDQLSFDLDGGEVFSLQNQADGKTVINANNTVFTIEADSYTGSPQLRLKESNSGYTRLYFENSNSDIIAIAAQPGATPEESIANFFLGGSNILTMLGSNRVGVNDATPAAGLEVNAAANDEVLIVRTGATTHMNIDDAGVTTINNQLTVDGILTIDGQYAFPTDYTNFSTLKTSIAGATFWGRTLWTEGTNDRIYNTVDDIGIGNAAPTYRLDVADSKFSDAVVKIRNNENNEKVEGLLIELNSPSSPTSNSRFVTCADGSGNKLGAIVGDGSGGVQLVQISDKRLKENIHVFDGGLDMVNQLNAYTYDMKVAPDEERIGFIAQELYDVFPQMVAGSPETTSEDNPMMVNYSAITPILLSAIKELSEENERLKDSIYKSEARLEKIENQLTSLMQKLN